jgi:hypothetical protein
MQTLTIPIWEDKGIIIGIFAYITHNHNELINNTIIINNNIYGSIIKMFFKELKFKKKIKSHYKNPFFINIKSNTLPHRDLYINNLNNFIQINNKKVRVLPWYDIDNPIIMFYHKNNGRYIDKDKLNEDILYFNNFIRYEEYGVPGKTKTNCVIDCWDTYYEMKILNKFVKLYPEYDAKYVNNMINEILLYPSCKDNKTVVVQGQPQYNQGCIPSEPIIKEVIKEIPGKTIIKEVIKEVIKKVPGKTIIEKVPGETIEIIKHIPCDHDKTNNINDQLIKVLNDKLDIVNNVLEKDVQELSG